MKKQILELTPIALFFITFIVTKDFILATLILVATTAIQLGISWLLFKRIEKMQWIPFLILLPLAGLTIAFDDDRFLKWKPSVVSWLFTVILWISHWVFKKNLVRLTLEAALHANEELHLDTDGVNWSRVNFLAGLFFLSTGVINIWVAFNYPTETWVQFKLFGMLVINALGMLMLFGYLSKHITANRDKVAEDKDDTD